MFFQVGLQAFRYDGVYDALDFQVAQLCLCLSFKLGVRYFDGNDAGETFPYIIAGKVVFILLQDAVLPGVVVEHPGEGGTEAGKVHAPFYGINIVDEGVHVFAVAHLVLHGDVHDDPVFFPFKGNNRRVYQVFSFIQELNEFRDAAGIMENVLVGGTVPVIGEGDGEALIQKSQFPHADFQRFVVEVNAFFEDFDIRLEGDGGTGFVGFPVGPHVFCHVAPGQFHFMEVAFSLDGDRHPFRQGVDYGNTYTVEAAGNGVAVAAEFAAGVEDSQDHFHGRFSGLMHACGDAAAVIGDRAAAVIVQGHFDVGAVAGQGFIDTVVHHFIDQVVEPPGGSGADIHARAEPDGFQPFQYSYILGSIVALAIFFCMVGLNFMNFFRHRLLLDKKYSVHMHELLSFLYIYNIYMHSLLLYHI